MLKTFFKNISNFIIPPLCVCCDTRIENARDFFCLNCASGLEKIDSAFYFSEKENFVKNADNALSIFKFSEDSCIQRAIHSLKYEKMKSLGILLGKKLGEEIYNKHFCKVDTIIPVPLHLSKLRERTFNQADYIAFGIDEIIKCGVDTKILERIRYTKSQTKLSSEERKDNVFGAFIVKKKLADSVKNKNILVVDDVITTGSTILECVRVLKENGCKSVTVCSLAVA